MKKERKFMGAKESLAQKHEMYPRPTFFSTGWKGQKIIQWCYKTITSFLFFEMYNKARTTFTGTNSKL